MVFHARYHEPMASLNHRRWILDDEQLVRWFLENGAQLNAVAQSPYETSILDLAAGCASIAVFDLMRENGASEVNGTPLHTAAACGELGGRIPMMTHLIDLGYDVNAPDDNRQPWNVRRGTPLQYAVLAKSVLHVQFLLRHGADPHKPGGSAGSAYGMAVGWGLKDILGLFEQSHPV
ncbi:MAG: hypothetical protein Q9168_002386 [Polycauliona sp. 1 TL-2023]